MKVLKPTLAHPGKVFSGTHQRWVVEGDPDRRSGVKRQDNVRLWRGGPLGKLWKHATDAENVAIEKHMALGVDQTWNRQQTGSTGQ